MRWEILDSNTRLKLPYENYKIGGDIINFFLEPATICFAIPLYKKREVLKKHWHHIMGGIAIGTVAALVIIYIVACVALVLE